MGLELNHLVKEYQPNCLINSRIGNGAYDYVSLNDNEYPTKREKADASIDPNSLSGFKVSPYDLYETPTTMNSSWGYKPFDSNYLKAEEIAKRRKKLNDLGINFLLNVGPDPLGRIPSLCAEELLKAFSIDLNHIK